MSNILGKNSMEKLFFIFESEKKEILIHEYYKTNQKYSKKDMAHIYQ